MKNLTSKFTFVALQGHLLIATLCIYGLFMINMLTCPGFQWYFCFIYGWGLVLIFQLAVTLVVKFRLKSGQHPPT